MKKEETLEQGSVRMLNNFDDINQYDKFISQAKKRMDNIKPDECILLMSSEIKAFKYGTDTVSVEERRRIVKFYESFITREKNIICLARAYGDNFITARYINSMDEENIIKRFRELISYLYQRAKEMFPDISVNVAIGVNIIRNSGCDVAAELDNANYARQEAEKTMSGIVIFRKEMLEERLRKVKFINEFETALANGEFQVYYQPKVDSLSHNVVGGEALIRWVKDDGTIIPPLMFIDLFEKNKYILKLDYFVYNQVFKYISNRLKNGQYVVPISMNVSRVHMENDNIIHYIKELLKKYNISPYYLEFEITENMCMLQMENTLKFIDEMEKLGITVSMDDFGSGYSSLNLLSEVPVDILKVDREFFKNWDKSVKKQIIIDSILSMAKRLHISVVCEGVEYLEQSKYLGLAGCEILQGYYFSMPVPERDFTKYIEEHKEVEKREFIFEFDKNLSDNSGVYTGKIVGDKVRFVSGMAKDRNVLYFPGGEPSSEIVEMPKIQYLNGDFSISVWIKSESVHIWTSIFYAEYENTFLSVMPLGKDQKAVFRIKDKGQQNGWYDILSTEVLTDRWTHLVASYNSESSTSSFYVNGMMTKSREVGERPEVLNRVMVGGDIYQKSFNGYMGEMRIYNYPMNIREIKELYEKQRKIYGNINENASD